MTDALFADNSIGSFQIGFSPIGSRPFDWTQTVISQYANSPTILQLLSNLSDYIDPAQDLDNFFDYVWNVDTAQGAGLDFWGAIVGVGRVLTVSNSFVFGFEEATTASASPFNQGTFYTGAGTTGNYALSDDAYRLLILAKAAANICDGSIPSINRILLNLFPNRGNCYCTNGADMTMTYTFSFALSSVEDAIVRTGQVLPTPVGTSFSIVVP